MGDGFSNVNIMKKLDQGSINLNPPVRSDSQTMTKRQKSVLLDFLSVLDLIYR